MSLPTKSDIAPVVNRLWRVSRVQRAVGVYDRAGGLANDSNARHYAAGSLARELRTTDNDAFELLADALARRAASNLVPTEKGLVP